jgi:hypothetical protein
MCSPSPGHLAPGEGQAFNFYLFLAKSSIMPSVNR